MSPHFASSAPDRAIVDLRSDGIARIDVFAMINNERGRQVSYAYCTGDLRRMVADMVCAALWKVWGSARAAEVSVMVSREALG